MHTWAYQYLCRCRHICLCICVCQYEYIVAAHLFLGRDWGFLTCKCSSHHYVFHWNEAGSCCRLNIHVLWTRCICLDLLASLAWCFSKPQSSIPSQRLGSYMVKHVVHRQGIGALVDLESLKVVFSAAWNLRHDWISKFEMTIWKRETSNIAPLEILSFSLVLQVSIPKIERLSTNLKFEISNCSRIQVLRVQAFQEFRFSKVRGSRYFKTSSV